MARAGPSLSVVVPVYNAAATLPELVRRLEPVLAARSPRFEVILVDDDSRDASWTVVESLARERSFVRGARLMRNFGQHNALLAGVRLARGEVVVTLDDDLQHPPEAIPALLDRLAGGCDVVYGTPERERHGLWRDLASRLTKLALRSAMGVETAEQVSAFRAFHTSLRDAFADYQSPFVSLDVLLTWATTRFDSIRVPHERRAVGASNYTFARLVRHALDMLTGFSVFPLQLASLIGFALTVFGSGVLAYVVGRYLIQGTSVPGFPFLASVIALFSGAQLFALGIIGEYLARMHFRSMGRPTYAIRARTAEREPGEPA
jgi:undecaprenyl-phosphate 4-deoxy-4-formamido-L-arabinose transferase